MKFYPTVVFLIISALLIAGCQGPAATADVPLTALSQVPADRLNFRYEADVPAPTEAAKAQTNEINSAIQADFDQRRNEEALDKVIASPDGKRVAVVYHKQTDLNSEFRLDMYSADGKQLAKMTSEVMAVHFPDTIRWSPDSTNLAFVAMVRGVQQNPDAVAKPPISEDPINSNSNAAVDPEADPEGNANTQPVAEPTLEAPASMMVFRTEQIYLANADGNSVKPITQNDGLIYFYYDWASDSSALVALAATQREWQYLQFRAESSGEIYVPVGRPRVVERSGRERRLDDALTAVHPVWSPDSMKVACAYDTQVRIYDAAGAGPTQAAIPLRNQLLLSSQAFDKSQSEQLNAPANSNAANAGNAAPVNAAPSNLQPTTLPDANTLVSFNPIIGLAWNEENILYFQTAFIKRMKKETDSVTSFPRWHRLVLSPQAVVSK
jgi:hypothetical protein